MTKKLLILAAIATIIFVSCEKKPIPTPEPTPTTTSGMYVLNSGSYNGNNSSLVFYDTKTQTVSNDVFLAKNGKKLGDTANDLLLYGGKMYISVTGSAVVFVTDLEGKIVKEITAKNGDANMQPRFFACDKGKVYVSYVEGHLGEIDTTSLNLRTLQVGAYPEGVAVANNKIYVSDSDGLNPEYGDKVVVVDPASFTVTKTITVTKNPQTLHKGKNGELYLVCYGNYNDVPATLMTIDTQNDVATPVADVVPTNFASSKGDYGYILTSTFDANWNQTVEYFKLDLNTKKFAGSFISSDKVTPNGYSIFVDDITKNVIIGASDFVNDGDIYIFSSEGNQIAKFDTKGINPISVAFIHE